MKKFSIITINLNNREGLKKTIESIVNQTCKDFEYIVIDGGSTDGSVDIIIAYSAKIDYWVSEPDKGIYNAMNKGILKATGEYCNFMNSGDCFHQKDVLEKVYSECQEDIVVGKMMIGDNPFPFGYPFQDISMVHFIRSSILHQASFIRRSLLFNNLYDEHYSIVSDWKFFIEVLIFQNHSFKNINIIIADFDDSGISNSHYSINKYERNKVLTEMLPERIYKDYILFSEINNSPILDLIPTIKRTNRFHVLTFKTLLFLVNIHKMYINIINIKKRLFTKRKAIHKL